MTDPQCIEPPRITAENWVRVCVWVLKSAASSRQDDITEVRVEVVARVTVVVQISNGAYLSATTLPCVPAIYPRVAESLAEIDRRAQAV